jgi:hypothetical protein
MIPLSSILEFLPYALKHPQVRRAAGAAIGGVVLAFLMMALFWWPVAQVHHGLEKSIEHFRQAQRDTIRSNETALNYRQLLQRSGLLETRWATPVSESSLIESLGQLASQNQLKVLSQDFVETPGKEGREVFQQNLSLNGTYPALRRFLSGLENLPTLTIIRQIRLERSEDKSARVRADIQLTTFAKNGKLKGS